MNLNNYITFQCTNFKTYMCLYLCDYKICHHMNGGWMDKDFPYGHKHQDVIKDRHIDMARK